MGKPENPFRYFNSSPEVIRMAVILYIRVPLSLHNVEDLLFEHGVKFVSVHASFHNHFNQERHLVDRRTYRERRSAALAEWQNLAA